MAKRALTQVRKANEEKQKLKSKNKKMAMRALAQASSMYSEMQTHTNLNYEVFYSENKLKSKNNQSGQAGTSSSKFYIQENTK